MNLRDESGSVLLKRQVSTQWDRVRTFLTALSEQAAEHGGWVAVVEVCGFNDWLLKELKAHGCHEIVIVQPTNRSSKKTDRRDAATLGEILWVNRENLLAGRRVQQVRRVVPPSHPPNIQNPQPAARGPQPPANIPKPRIIQPGTPRRDVGPDRGLGM